MTDMTPVTLLSLRVWPKTPADRVKLDRGLEALMADDTAMRARSTLESDGVVIEALSERHLEIIIDRLGREFAVEAGVGLPRVIFKETVTRAADGEMKFTERIDGRGQYAHAKMHVNPGDSGSGYVFKNAIVGGAIPERFIRAIDLGVRNALERGILAGHRMDDVHVELYDGTYHDVDSSDAAFRIAGSLAFQDAARKAGPILLEPVMRVQVVVPEEHAEAVADDLLKRRGRLESRSEYDGTVVVNARVPFVEMFAYWIGLRERTQGRGSVDMRFERYEPIAPNARSGDDLQPTPVAPIRPLPTLGPLKAEAREPDDDGGAG